MAKEDKRVPDHAYLNEVSINADGTADLIVGIHASSPDGIDRVKEEVDDLLGYEGERVTSRGNGKYYGFSSGNWNSPWNPPGPKPNWRVGPPDDPHAN